MNKQTHSPQFVYKLKSHELPHYVFTKWETLRNDLDKALCEATSHHLEPKAWDRSYRESKRLEAMLHGFEMAIGLTLGIHNADQLRKAIEYRLRKLNQ